MTDETLVPQDVAAEPIAAEQPVETPVEQAEQPAPDERRNKTTARERFAQMTRQKHDLARQVREKDERIKALESAAVPKLDDYPDLDSFEVARTGYAIGQYERKNIEREVQSLNQRATEIVATEFSERVAEFIADAPDFEQVAMSVPWSPFLAEMIAGMDNGPAVAYHIGKNRALAREISGLSPAHAALEVQRIAQSIRPAAAKVTTSAPAPIAPATGGAAPQKTLSDMTYNEYVAARRAQQKA